MRQLLLFNACLEDKIFAQMRHIDVCYLTGLAQMAVSTCTATNENTLECLFPEDINALQKDFVLLFYDDRGDDGNCLMNDEVSHFGTTTIV